jgi:hypothetical protein
MRSSIALAVALSFLLPPKCLRKKAPEDQPLGGAQGGGFFGADNTQAPPDDDSGAAAAASASAAAAKPAGNVGTVKPAGAVAAKDVKDAGAAVAATASASGTPATAGGTLGGPGQCIRALKLASFHVSASSCTLNEEVRNRPANLTFPCAGGDALAAFGSQVFKGKVTGENVVLTNVSPFQFEGCPWQSTQTITGSVKNKTLVYTYAEALKSTEARCKSASPCTASGVVSVQ